MCLVLLVLIVEEVGVVVLLHEGLWWLVNVHVGHLLSSLVSSSFLLLFLLFALLNLFKLIEDVLVVQQCVRELVHESLASQESIDSALNYWNFQELMDCWSLRWIFL